MSLKPDNIFNGLLGPIDPKIRDFRRKAGEGNDDGPE